MEESGIAILLGLVISFSIILQINESEKKIDENLLKSCEVIETYINTTKHGNNNYILILENQSGDLFEIDTDINTFVKYGGKLKK